MAQTKVAVVTGANKGIGFEIVKGLCQRFQGLVFLTARNAEKGQQAVNSLKEQGFKPEFHQLDIEDKTSVERFRDHIVEKHGGIDILINNAGFAFKKDDTSAFSIQAERTTAVNYFGLVTTSQIVLPIVKDGGRVVNISSYAGHLSMIQNETLKRRFAKNDLTVEELSELVRSFVDYAKKKDAGETVAEEWPSSSYVVSKVAVSALTFIQQRELSTRGIKVNCCHPGYVKTDMTSQKGHITPAQGALAPLYLALDAPDDLRGVYLWCDNTVYAWDGPDPLAEKASTC